MSSMNINDALKGLYLALGGDSSAIKNGMTVTDYVALLKNVLSGGEKSYVIVNIDWVEGEPVASKTFEELKQAWNQGKFIYFYDSNFGFSIANYYPGDDGEDEVFEAHYSIISADTNPQDPSLHRYRVIFQLCHYYYTESGLVGLVTNPNPETDMD